MLTDEPVRELIEATNRALVEPLHRLTLNEEVSFDLQTALEQNTFVFSGFKTHHELTEAAQLLKGDDGRFKPFSQFRTDIQALNQNYNGNYLRAEYNFATASTQMAAKWQQWAEDGDEYNLQYRTANDDRVREEHAALHGTTLPPSDPFWDSYLPPNGWNCRCTAVQVLKYKYPESDSAKAIAAAAGITDTPKKQIFRFNPGKQMKVFPPKHPYLPKGCGNCDRRAGRSLEWRANRIWCRACDEIQKCYRERESENASKLKKYTVAEKQAIYNKPVEEQFSALSKNVSVHELRDKNAMDYGIVTDAAILFGKESKVLIMPEIHVSETDVRQRLGLTGKSNPDLKVGKEWVDVKSPFSIKEINANACKAQQQNAIACITDNHCVLDIEMVPNYAQRIFRSQGYSQNTVYFIVEGKLYKYDRQD